MTDLDWPAPSEAKRSIESLQQIARLAHRVTGSAGVLLSVFDGNIQHILGAAGPSGAPYEGESVDAGGSMCSVVVETGRPLVCEDTHADDELAGHPAVTEGGVRAYLGFPLRDLDDAVIGSLCAWEDHPRHWDDEIVGDLRDLAGCASTQLSFARLARERAGSRGELLTRRAFDTAVLDSLAEGVVACDENGRLSLFNRALREIHGSENASDADWAPTYQLYTEDGDRLLEPDEVPLARAFAGERVVDQPMTVGGDDTERRVYLATGTQLADTDGHRIGAVVAMREVTDERRRHRFDAAQLEAATRLANDPSGDAVPVVLEVLREAFRTSDVTFETFNDGTDAPDVPGVPSPRLLGTNRAELTATVQAAGRPAGALRVIGEAGELRDQQAAALLTALAGMVTRQLELAHVRELSDDLHRAQAELERVVEQIEDFVFSIEVLPDGRTLPVLMGSSGGVLGAEIDRGDWREFMDDHVHPDDADELRTWRRELQAGRTAQLTCRLRGLDGVTRWVWIRSKPRVEGDRFYVDGICTDVTDRQQLHHERDQLVREQARQVEELKSLDAAKSEFVATVAHEIRGPLGVVVTFAEHAAEAMSEDGGPLAASMGSGMTAARRSSGLAARTAGHLQQVVENLFDLARYDAGALSPDSYDVDLTALLEDVQQSAALKAAEKNLSLELDAGSEPITIRADATKLRQAIDNLVGNAVKFTPAGGSVRLTCSVDEQAVELRIADTGIGIPADDLPHLFSRFYRASNARTTETPGTGLGLALARSIVEAHGGELAVEPSTPHGTVVTLRLSRSLD